MAAIMPSAYRLDKKLTPHPFLIRDEDGKVLTKNLGFIFEGRKSIYSVFHSTKDRHLHLEQPKVFGCKVKLADGIILIIQDGVKIHANLVRHLL